MFNLWPQEVTRKSKEFLEELKGLGLDFVLIGGWAIYLISKYSESKDIDLLVPKREFWKLKTYMLSKGAEEKVNPLGKTGYKLGEVELDVYTDDLCSLPLSIKEIFEKEQYIKIDNIKVLKPEILLKLKIAAAEGRRLSHKGLKDRCDILSVLINYKINFDKMDEEDKQKLKYIILNAKSEYDYVMKKELTPSEIKKIKAKLINELKK